MRPMQLFAAAPRVAAGLGNVHAKEGNVSKPFAKAWIERAQITSASWQASKFSHPLTREIEHKGMYSACLEDAVVCGGLYK